MLAAIVAIYTVLSFLVSFPIILYHSVSLHTFEMQIVNVDCARCLWKWISLFGASLFPPNWCFRYKNSYLQTVNVRTSNRQNVFVSHFHCNNYRRSFESLWPERKKTKWNSSHFILSIFSFRKRKNGTETNGRAQFANKPSWQNEMVQ